MEPTHLTPRQTADTLCLKSTGTLSNWRCQGRGPRYVVHGRNILYSIAAVDEYKRAHFKPVTARPITRLVAV